MVLCGSLHIVIPVGLHLTDFGRLLDGFVMTFGCLLDAFWVSFGCLLGAFWVLFGHRDVSGANFDIFSIFDILGIVSASKSESIVDTFFVFLTTFGR